MRAIRELAAEARRNGYAWGNEEYFRGDINVAAPARDANGKALGAIDVSLPKSRWTLEANQVDPKRPQAFESHLHSR
ncbi:MAG: IclR family transcriptional regulator C-terminal domain-containing protein [Roseiarcus sp.]